MPDPYARIFLLSHMRAYTSLAAHILGSHPQINGYYEMHLSYEDPSALERQLAMFLQGDALKANLVAKCVPEEIVGMDSVQFDDFLKRRRELTAARVRSYCDGLRFGD